MNCSAVLVAALIAAVLAGCAGTEPQPETPESNPSSARSRGIDRVGRDQAPGFEARGSSDNPWVSCYASFTPGADPALDLVRLTSACAAPAGFTAVTPVHVGEPQSEEAPEERFNFLGRAGRCYRVFSVGDADVADLDIAILRSDGRLIAADASRDRFPIVPTRGPLCLQSDQIFTVHVAVVQGSGSYLLQVWGGSKGK